MKNYVLLSIQVVSRPNFRTQKKTLHYESLPGVETVHSTLTVKATQDLFKDNKIRLRCLANLLSVYSRFQEVELQGYPTQLALIMVPTETNIKGIYECYFMYLYLYRVG